MSKGSATANRPTKEAPGRAVRTAPATEFPLAGNRCRNRSIPREIGVPGGTGPVASDPATALRTAGDTAAATPNRPEKVKETQKPRKKMNTISPLASRLNLIFTLLASSVSLNAKQKTEGVIFFKASSLSGPETAQAREYTKVQITPRILNCVDTNGIEFKILQNQVVQIIKYPDLETGSIQTPQQVNDFMKLGRNLRDSFSKYPLSKSVIAPRLNEFIEAAKRLNEGMILVSGEWQQQKPQDPKMLDSTSPTGERSNLDQIVLKTKTGKTYEIEKINDYQENSILAVHTGGVATLMLENLTDASLKLLEQNPIFKRIKAEFDENLAAMAGTRAGELRSFGGIEMVWCPPGDYWMGSPETENGRRNNGYKGWVKETRHRVTHTQGFWLAKTETTQEQWESKMKTNLSQQKAKGYSIDFGESTGEGANHPIHCINLDDAQNYLKRLNADSPLPNGWKWVLPTEAQWEYACRAGTETPFAGEIDDLAWYSKNSGPAPKTHPVAKKKPNAWGLYDMHGNVSEWCSDQHGVYEVGTIGANSDGKPTHVLYSMHRGGHWAADAAECRSASRSNQPPYIASIWLGFRAAAVFHP